MSNFGGVVAWKAKNFHATTAYRREAHCNLLVFTSNWLLLKLIAPLAFFSTPSFLTDRRILLSTMSADIFKQAQHLRRVYDFKSISIVPEESALVVHSLLTVQFLDNYGKLLHEQKKNQQQKFPLLLLS